MRKTHVLPILLGAVLMSTGCSEATKVQQNNVNNKVEKNIEQKEAIEKPKELTTSQIVKDENKTLVDKAQAFLKLAKKDNQSFESLYKELTLSPELIALLVRYRNKYRNVSALQIIGEYPFVAFCKKMEQFSADQQTTLKVMTVRMAKALNQTVELKDVTSEKCENTFIQFRAHVEQQKKDGVETADIKLNLHHEISMKGNSLPKLKALLPYMFIGLESLTKLELYNNEIEHIGKFDLWGLNGLQYLDIENGSVESLHKNTFLGLQNLTALYLGDNSSIEVPGGIFAPLQSLKTLTLRKALIESEKLKTLFNGPVPNELQTYKNTEAEDLEDIDPSGEYQDEEYDEEDEEYDEDGWDEDELGDENDQE